MLENHSNPLDLLSPDDDAKAMADALVLREGTEPDEHQDVLTVQTIAANTESGV
jgi:hypothetical protein